MISASSKENDNLFYGHVDSIYFIGEGIPIELTASTQSTHVSDLMEDFLLFAINDINIGMSQNTYSSIFTCICKQVI